MKNFLERKYLFVVALLCVLISCLFFFFSSENNYEVLADEYNNAVGDNISEDQVKSSFDYLASLKKKTGQVVGIVGEKIENGIHRPIKVFSDIRFIPNANYFLLNPQHKDNDQSDNSMGTCTTVAAQMVMGYHNYYSDRRLIPQKSGNRQFLSDDYGDIKNHPIFSREMVKGQGCSSIGTQDGFYRELFDRTPFADWFFGQGVNLVTWGVNNFLDEFLSAEVRKTVNFVCEFFSYKAACSEIDNGRPIILGMSGVNTDMSFHVVPAYGYAKLDGEDGFFVHCGWGEDVVLGWYPANLFGFQMRMSVNHQHNLIDTGERVEKSKNDINGDTQKENYTILKCVECEYTTPDFLYETSGTTITKAKYNISGICKIPDSFEAFNPDKGVFESTDINTIGELAFDGQSQITGLFLTNKIETIHKEAFRNCIKLEELLLPSETKNIYSKAFSGTQLSRVYYTGNRQLFDEGNYNGNFNLVEVYYFSSLKQRSGTYHWRYVDGYPKIWEDIVITATPANGSSGCENTTQITLTFSEDPGILNASNFNSKYCNITRVSGSGVTRTLYIKKLRRVYDQGVISITVTSFYCYFANPEISVMVYRKCAYVEYRDYGRSFFSGSFDTLYYQNVFFEPELLPIPNKKGYEFDGWYTQNGNGLFQEINRIPDNYLDDNDSGVLVVYAKWKRLEPNSSLNYPSRVGITYYTRGEEFNPRDMFFVHCGTNLNDLSYALRETMLPALSRLSYNGYTYEYNIDLIDDMVISEDLLTATITLKGDIKFSDGALIKAEDFKAYYEIIKGMYSVLPEPWSSISSVDVVNDSVFTINLTDRRDLAYILHEFRAIPKNWLDNSTESGEDPFEDITMIPVYGKYKIDRYEPNYKIEFTANEDYLWAADTRITYIDIFLISDVTTTIVGFQSGEYGACFNLVYSDLADYTSSYEESQECHLYDDRTRYFLGIGRESVLFRNYTELQLSALLKVLGRSIDYKKLNEVFIDTIREESGWYTDKMIDLESDGLSWWASPKSDRLGIGGVTEILTKYDIDINDLNNLNLHMYVPDNDICRKIAGSIIEDLEAVGISVRFNLGQDKSYMRTSDLCLFAYDFTGANLLSDDILNFEDFDNLFSPYAYEESEIYPIGKDYLTELKSRYVNAETEEDKKQIMLEVHDIMIQYVVKLNAILKMYLVSNELYEATGGDVWKLIY